MKRVLVFEHVDDGGLWALQPLFARDGVETRSLRLDRGEGAPDFAGFDGLVALGGPMQVWEEAAHPWLAWEKAYIRDAIVAGAPVLGVCLGHQLIAEAMGGAAALAETPEIGVVEVIAKPRDDALIEGGPRVQWHLAEIARAPDGAEVLAHSAACAVQAMRVGRAALSAQYHVEATAETLRAWGRDPGAVETVEARRGAGGFARLVAEAEAAQPALARHAEALYGAWVALARG